jgi:hypothetical protein
MSGQTRRIRGPPSPLPKSKAGGIFMLPGSPMRAWRNRKTHTLWERALGGIAGSNPAARTTSLEDRASIVQSASAKKSVSLQSPRWPETPLSIVNINSSFTPDDIHL